MVSGSSKEQAVLQGNRIKLAGGPSKGSPDPILPAASCF
jgi:hypothetical protein